MRKILSIRALLFTLVVLAASTASSAQVRISVEFGPPALPVYEQPLCPGDGYIWTPGYWAWDDDDADYYWVPGTWVLAPEVGYLWTPPYWAWSDGAFVFYDGYWGPHVGFYGGVVYGFGYFGFGFVGGRWQGDRFYYNREVMNVNEVVVHNVYRETVINNNVTVNRVSYNGGPGGVQARPRPEDEAAARERHMPPASVQAQHIQTARTNPQLRASANRGKPPVAATPKPAEFHSAVPAKEAGAPYNPPANRRGGAARNANGAPSSAGRPPAEQPSAGHPSAVHPKELPPFQRPGAANGGNPKQDQRYQQQQEKMFAKQEQERQKLQQKQEQDHQRLAQQNADASRKQQVEQRHQQQTEQLQQKHVQQQQRLQTRQPPPPKQQPQPKHN
jgi:hypothetical protein